MVTLQHKSEFGSVVESKLSHSDPKLPDIETLQIVVKFLTAEKRIGAELWEGIGVEKRLKTRHIDYYNRKEMRKLHKRKNLWANNFEEYSSSSLCFSFFCLLLLFLLLASIFLFLPRASSLFFLRSSSCLLLLLLVVLLLLTTQLARKLFQLEASQPKQHWAAQRTSPPIAKHTVPQTRYHASAARKSTHSNDWKSNGHVFEFPNDRSQRNPEVLSQAF